tara:strand:- start:1059 stop:1352 length:294 start_codon:yes stop_codon:yes gene_type:complete
MPEETAQILRTRYVRHDGIESEDTGQEVLVYLPGGDRTLYLNDTAAIVWRLCGGEYSGEEIAEMLEEAYPDAAATIRDEVAATLRGLADQQLVEARD